MALKYHIVKKRDMRPGAPEGATLYFGQIRSKDRVNFNELCEEIQQLTFSTDSDVQGIMEGLLLMLRNELSRGNLVELGSLGSFRMSAGAPGVERPEEFTTSMFRRARVVYTPGKLMKKITEKTNIHYDMLKFPFRIER